MRMKCRRVGCKSVVDGVAQNEWIFFNCGCGNTWSKRIPKIHAAGLGIAAILAGLLLAIYLSLPIGRTFPSVDSTIATMQSNIAWNIKISGWLLTAIQVTLVILMVLILVMFLRALWDKIVEKRD